MKQKLLRLVKELVPLLLILWVAHWWQTRNLIEVGSAIPDQTYSSLQGQEVTLTDQTVPTVLYFFATWCTVCKFSTPNLVDLRQDRTTQELNIIGIALSWDDQSQVEDYIQQYDINFPVILAPPEVGRNFNISAFPTIYIVDNEGKVQSRTAGFTTETGLKLRTM